MLYLLFTMRTAVETNKFCRINFVIIQMKMNRSTTKLKREWTERDGVNERASERARASERERERVSSRKRVKIMSSISGWSTQNYYTKPAISIKNWARHRHLMQYCLIFFGAATQISFVKINFHVEIANGARCRCPKMQMTITVLFTEASKSDLKINQNTLIYRFRSDLMVSTLNREMWSHVSNKHRSTEPRQL